MAIPRGTGIISITVNTRGTENMFTGLVRTIPEGARIGTKKLAGIYAEKYLNQLPRAGIQPWTRQSENILQRQITNPILLSNKPVTYGVLVPGNLIALDQMETHPVWLKKGRPITLWAARKGLKGFIMKKLSAQTGQIERGIIVKPHPWIQNANRNARRKIGIISREVDKKIRRKGKR